MYVCPFQDSISFHIRCSHSLSSWCSCHGEHAVLVFLVHSCLYAFDISLNRLLPFSNVNPLCLFHLSRWNSLARCRYARVISLAVALCWSPRVRKAVVVPVLVVRRRRGVSRGGEGVSEARSEVPVQEDKGGDGGTFLLLSNWKSVGFSSPRISLSHLRQSCVNGAHVWRSPSSATCSGKISFKSSCVVDLVVVLGRPFGCFVLIQANSAVLGAFHLVTT